MISLFLNDPRFCEKLISIKDADIVALARG